MEEPCTGHWQLPLPGRNRGNCCRPTVKSNEELQSVPCGEAPYWRMNRYKFLRGQYTVHRCLLSLKRFH
ncbi:hypothetical protein Y1Q_0012620 [Alligator mississippiensis]|uniref:Uncharacterized protein n=1 Tax=Alligator mississippiensis TaxID=8496 RepID=A0A151M8B0_ALLMI|nr:hypothetical protein Y1Q_0012620 [Alligator mississippiensis]